MKVDQRWRRLGWRHPLWDYVRFYSVVRGQRKDLREQWTDHMKKGTFEIVPGQNIEIDPDHSRLFFQYLDYRDRQFKAAFELLRTEEQALTYCEQMKVQVSKNVTQLPGYYQASKALIAAVTSVATIVCASKGTQLIPSPQRRCAWLTDKNLHVTARNLDGAIPTLTNPSIVWEIKEYWGKTDGGSKMSDALYECNLVGREIREYEERSKSRITHIVFLDGRDQWNKRKSDLMRFLDIFHQGLIDYLFIGKEVETEWETTLRSLL